MTFDEFLKEQPQECHGALRSLRELILEVLPQSEELINYGVWAFTLVPGGKREQQIMISGYKKHIGLYPHPATMEHFEEKLTSYKRGKGSVQFPLKDPLPEDLIREMVLYRSKMVNQ